MLGKIKMAVAALTVATVLALVMPASADALRLLIVTTLRATTGAITTLTSTTGTITTLTSTTGTIAALSATTVTASSGTFTGSLKYAVKTKAQFSAMTGVVGASYLCSDCTIPYSLCVGTGTTLSGWKVVHSATVGCGTNN